MIMLHDVAHCKRYRHGNQAWNNTRNHDSFASSFMMWTDIVVGHVAKKSNGEVINQRVYKNTVSAKLEYSDEMQK
jgi:hypothetical protein